MTQLMAPPQQKQQQITNWKAPVGSMDGLRELIGSDGVKKSIMDMLPKHITPERLLKTLLVAANRNPKIFDCTKLSILECINRAAELGLDLSGTLGEAYPVPYGQVCTLIIGYRGLEKLAWQSGEIESIDAEVVHSEDTFEFRKGTEVYVNWSPKLTGDRGAPIGAYACVKMKGGGKLARFLPVDEIEKIRKVSKSGSSGPWSQWWGEMARKTALRRVLKDAPLSTEKFVAAMEHNSADSDFSDVIEANTGRPHLGNAAVLARLGAPATHPDGTPITAPAPVEDEAEAARILEEKAAQARHDTQDAPPAEQAVEQGDEGVITSPIPAHGRTSEDWINDEIVQRKPKELSAHQARSRFHKLHAPKSWHTLTHDAQDALYGALVAGEIDWS